MATTTEPKVQFNLKNVHYARKTANGWETPKAVPGAVSLALDPQGEIKQFYADGIVYFRTTDNRGYSGDLEMAKFPDQMLIDVWGYKLGATSKVLTEYAESAAIPFALLFQIDTDAENELNVLYSCSGSRPNIGSNTTGESIEPVTQRSTITAVPMDSGAVLARTTANTPAGVRANWFEQVFVESDGG